MNNMSNLTKKMPRVLDVVALLDELPQQCLTRGQVGTVVEILDKSNLLVEFSDEKGQAYAITAVQQSKLLVLHYVPEAA